MQSLGYDSIKYENTQDREYGEPIRESFILFKPEQLKSADVVTYDDDGNPIPLSQRFNPKQEDFRFSRRLDPEQLKRWIESIRKEGKAKGLSEEEIEGEIRKAARESYLSLVDEYGAIEPGEKPAREVQVPQKTAKDKKVSQTVRTVLEEGATPEQAVPTIQQMVATGDFSYDTYTDKQAIQDARDRIAGEKGLGWDNAQREWFDSMKRGEVSKENTTMGWVLYNNAANSGNIVLAMDILNEMVLSQRNAAQALRATRILKKLSPETQLYQVQWSVESLQEERDEIQKNIYRDIGRQMPSTFKDKWNAWRYLAMLGNPRRKTKAPHFRAVLFRLSKKSVWTF